MIGDIFDVFIRNLVERGLEYFKLYYGFYRGVCMGNEDPEGQYRIKVKVPIITKNAVHSKWAWPLVLWGKKEGGSVIVPDMDDPVWVCFENGNPQYPMYFGGWIPKPESGTYAMSDVYTDGVPTKRVFFKTKAGHEFSVEDNQENLSIKLIWHDPVKDVYTFFAITPDGSVQVANHKGCMVELRATDDEELVLVVDKAGNSFTMNKDGIKVVESTGNMIELTENLIQLIGTKDLVMNMPGINMKTGGVTIGDVATDSALKGTSWRAWWTGIVLTWLNTHTHPTGVGPSGPPLVPIQAPAQTLLTDKLKMQ